MAGKKGTGKITSSVTKGGTKATAHSTSTAAPRDKNGGWTK